MASGPQATQGDVFRHNLMTVTYDPTSENARIEIQGESEAPHQDIDRVGLGLLIRFLTNIHGTMR